MQLIAMYIVYISVLGRPNLLSVPVDVLKIIKIIYLNSPENEFMKKQKQSHI